MRAPYHTTDVFGVTYVAPDEDQLHEVLDTLEDADLGEHPYVSLTHRSGWTLSFYDTGVLLWEKLAGDDPDAYDAAELDSPPRFLRKVSRKDVLRYWEMLAEGQIAELQRLKWKAEE